MTFLKSLNLNFDFLHEFEAIETDKRRYTRRTEQRSSEEDVMGLMCKVTFLRSLA